MSRYQWPVAGAGEAHADDPAARSRFTAPRRLDFDPEGARAASRATPAIAPRAPPDTRAHLWQPLGPQTVIGGQAAGGPRISGRINALGVHPLGERIYAASANGGVWYSGDGGANWASLAGFATTNVAGITRPAHRNACGAIEVEFGATAAADVVWVGTGEVSNPIDAQPGSSLGGIGMLRAEHPVTSAEADPWHREANNLIGTGVYKIVRDPAGTGAVIAATRRGLFQRKAVGAGPEVDWERPSGTPFNDLNLPCTDAIWTPALGARPARLWVWVETAGHAGLWVRANGTANFSKVAIAAPVVAGAPPVAYSPRRAALAAAASATQVWALNDAGDNTPPLLFRVSNPDTGGAAPLATLVRGVPDLLRTQGSYDIAIDVHPARADTVVLGGCCFPITTAENFFLDQEGAVIVGDVALNGAVLTFGPPATPFTMIGIGVHADIHGVYFAKGGDRLFACCDGGVFRSDRPQRPAGFYACNNGLQVVESNYVSNHPRCEGFVAAGLQDNAAIERHSSSVWKRVPYSSGDGGGILVLPLRPQYLLFQYVRSNWKTSDGILHKQAMLTRGAAPNQTYATAEENASSFYSNAAGILTTRTAALAVGQVIIGTTRVWYTEQTLRTAAPAVETKVGSAWYTLPTGATPTLATDPLPGSLTRDAFGEAITVCRWQDRDVAWALGEGRVVRYQREPGSDNAGPPGRWSAETVLKKGVKNKRDATRADGPVRESPVWTDIAVNLDKPAAPGGLPRPHGTKGALYLGTIGHPANPEVDTLWWFDGTSKWFKTGLRTDAEGVPAPVTAIVCDAAFPEEVYVGTTVGVWKGIRTQVGTGNPAWTWHKRLNGVPEAAVEDLAIFSDGGIRLLRAAIAARGVWELRLDLESPDDLTYVRAHGDDLRRVLLPDAADPSRRTRAVDVERDNVTLRSWHGSPDVRPHTKIALVPKPLATSFPFTREVGLGEDRLRRFQAALRASTHDPRVRANGLWDAYFSEVLRDLGAAVVARPPVDSLPARNLVAIDAAFWDTHMTPANEAVEPWGADPPTEADLLEFTPALYEGVRAGTSCTLPRRPTRIDVVVHHRGLDARAGADVRVTLLKWVDPRTRHAADFSDASTWFAGNVPWAAAVNDVLDSPAGASTATFPGTGWSFVGTTNPTRRRTLTGQTLDALHSGVATFELNLATVRNNEVVLLVAVIRAGAGPSAIAPATLEALAMGDPNVAVRSIRANP